MNKILWLLVAGCSTQAFASSEIRTPASLNVLVVEDSLTSYKIVERTLKERFEVARAEIAEVTLLVTHVKSCEEGLAEVDKALASGNGPDMLIIDQNLTGKMKGTEFATRARSKSLESNHKPIMILNSDDSTAEEEFRMNSDQEDPVFRASTGKSTKVLKEALSQIIPEVVERKLSK